MISRFLVAGAAAAGLLVTLGLTLPAAAVPMAQPDTQVPAGVTLVRQGGGGHGGGGFRGGGGFHGGGHSFRGGGHSFRGGSFRGFRGGGHHYSGGRHHGGHAHGGPRVHHRGHRGVRYYPGFYGYAPYYYGSDYFYDDGDGCAYLRERALETGSRYWWRRYRACAGH